VTAPTASGNTHAHILERLSADKDAKPFEILVLAALEGPDALRQALDQNAKPKHATTRQQQPAKPQAAYLKRITVEGFRGIGPQAKLDIPPGPGLTLVVGRNGSGKSSFAEALELLLTGDTYRWKQRTKVWREGWRNLHHQPAAIETECLIEGKKGPTQIRQAWADGQDLDEATTTVQPHGEPKTDRQALGWDGPLQTYRPFLSYNELGSMLDEGPSKLFDALAKILGLDDLVGAQNALADERKSREKDWKDCETERTQRILPLLEQADDPRAQAVRDAVTKKSWDPHQAEAALRHDEDSSAAKDLATLRELASLQAPTHEAVRLLANELRHTHDTLQATKGTLAAKSKELAEILDHVLAFHEHYGDGDCPVCGSKKALDKGWSEKNKKLAMTLREKAREATLAQQQADAARKKATQLPIPKLDQAPPQELQAAHEKAKQAKDAWLAGLAKQANDLAAHLETHHAPLEAAIDDLKRKAEAELRNKEDKWRPVADTVRQWLTRAKQAKQRAESTKDIKSAEAWLKQANEDLRNQRFAPIKEKSQKVWNQLRMQSSVALEDIRLAGSSTQRKVELHVTVDGKEGAALGVMSQGELHALALSLFIPRATLPESPFRFIVIDDPVQSMDPARVDGLARVLEAAAKDRQVLVFTHDDRLPEAVRRLDVRATIVEVTRREGSVVECRESKDPVSRYISDAILLSKTQNLPKEAARRVIPGFCRSAIEAACAEVVRKRRLRNGLSHAEVERALERATTMQFAAMAIFDDVQRTDDVLSRLNKEKRDYADAFKLCQTGAHEGIGGDPLTLVRDVEKLTTWLRAQA
jgi:predicted ATPase